MICHCLFEQSGTFKNEFRKLGFTAYDYDIRDDFRQTDYRIDLFREINNAYVHSRSIFDRFKKEDLVLAFFPCVRFSKQISMHIRGYAYGVRDWSDDRKLEYSMHLVEEVSDMYNLLCKLFIICITRGLMLIVENPSEGDAFLNRYFPIPPTIVDMDRRKFGDKFKKPTQYWFINLKPKNNINFEICEPKNGGWVTLQPTIERSMIDSDYANRFIRDFIVENPLKEKSGTERSEPSGEGVPGGC